MSHEELISPAARERLEELLSSDVYRENLDFWERAWSQVKTAYTQLPDLAYLTSIPKTLEQRSVRTVLDLGCGTGWLSIYLAKQGFQVTGLDISMHAIKLAREWAAKEDLDIHFDVGDIADMPYPDSSFDAIVANSIFEHFPFDVADITMKRLKHILVPGGTFIGCFDKVGGGPGEYFELADKTHVYTDKHRKGMMLRYYKDAELRQMLNGWKLETLDELESGTRFTVAFT
jgi:SAM-dependent methyltransferase